jgi:hypothetical protein
MRCGEKDWLIRTDATPAVTAIFRQAHRLAAARTANVSTQATSNAPGEKTEPTARSPEAWCHVVADFAGSPANSMTCPK